MNGQLTYDMKKNIVGVSCLASGYGIEVFHQSKECKGTVIIPCQGMIDDVNFQQLDVAFVLGSSKSIVCMPWFKGYK